MAERRRKFWGWGYEDQGPNPEQQKRIAERMAARFGLGELTIAPPPRVEELNLRAPRVKPPDSLAAICLSDTYERAFHSYGRSFRDIVRAFRRYYPNPVDVVAYPRIEAGRGPRARMVRRRTAWPRFRLAAARAWWAAWRLPPAATTAAPYRSICAIWTR